MAKPNTRRQLPAEEMVDVARSIVIRAMESLRLDIQAEAHVQAREYARVAAAAGLFRGSPGPRQDATTKGHLAARFERRLAPLLDTMRAIHDPHGTMPYVMVPAMPDPVYVDARDLAMLDEGLRIVADDQHLFDRITVRDLTPPASEADRHVMIDVARRDGRILVIATAISNAVYGVAGIHLDEQGDIIEIIDPTGAHDEAPLDETVLDRLWTIIGVGARTQGRTQAKIRRSRERTIETVTVTAVEESPMQSSPEEKVVDVKEDGLPSALPGVIEPSAPLDRMRLPIIPAPFTDETFAPYADRMATNPATRILLDVYASGIVAGRLPDDQGEDVVTKLYIEGHRRSTEEMIRQTRKRYKEMLSDPELISKYEEYSVAAMDKTLERARELATSPIGQRFNILLRLMCMHAHYNGPIETSALCEGDGRASLSADRPVFGILIVKNRTLFDIARHEHEEEDDCEVKVRREVPLCIVYRLDATGAVGVVHQMDGRHTNLILEFDLPADAPENEEEEEEESELGWAIRNALRDVVARRASEEVDRSAEATIAETQEACQDTSDAFAPGAEFTHGLPTNRRLRRHAQVSLEVCDYAAAARMVDAWFDRTAKGHSDALMLDRRSHESGWRIEHASDDDMHVWAVDVHAGPENPPRIEIVVETTQERADPALPGLVREIAEAIETKDLDGPINLAPGMIVSRSQMRALMDELTSQARRLPILVLTTDEYGNYMIDPDQVARRTAGYLRVRCVSPSMTREMRDAWGQEFTVFNGAARIYQPGFDPDRSNPLAHQRFMPGRTAQQNLNNAIKREASATLSRYQIGDRLRQDLAEAARDAVVDDIPSVMEESPPLPLELAGLSNGNDDQGHGEEEGAPADEPVGNAADIQLPDDGDIEEAPHHADVDQELVGHEDKEGSADEPELMPDKPFPHEEAPEAVESQQGEELPLHDDLEARIARIVNGAMAKQTARIEAIEAHIVRVERERDTAFRQVDAVRERALDSARREREENDRNRIDDAELIRIAEQERDDALAEIDRIRQDLEEVIARNRALEVEIERLRNGDVAEEPRPKTLAEIGDWANIRFAGRITILPRACKALRKSNYADVERAVRMVELFAGPYVDARRKVEGAHERWIEGMESIRVKDYKQVDAGGPEDQQYHVRHEGRTIRLDRHVKGNESSSRERGAFRVYYTYDEQSGQVVIGWMPDHLTTAAT